MLLMAMCIMRVCAYNRSRDRAEKKGRSAHQMVDQQKPGLTLSLSLFSSSSHRYCPFHYHHYHSMLSTSHPLNVLPPCCVFSFRRARPSPILTMSLFSNSLNSISICAALFFFFFIMSLYFTCYYIVYASLSYNVVAVDDPLSDYPKAFYETQQPQRELVGSKSSFY